MVEGSLKKLNAGAFLELASLCGLELRELDLAQMARRRLVAPYEAPGGMTYYTVLHLFVMAQYCRAISPMRHPWGTRPPEHTLDEVSAVGERLNEILVAAWQGRVAGAAGEREVAVFFRALEDFLARIDPFGPLAEVFDFLQPAVIDRVRNRGRLYLELRRGAVALAQLLEANSDFDEGPLTQPMFGVEEDRLEAMDDLRSTQVIDESVSRTSEAARSAMDSVFDAAEAAAEPVRAAQERTTRPIEREPDEMQVVELDLEQIPVEELVEESSPQAVDVSGGPVEESKPAAPPELPPQAVVVSAEQRIAELNRLRERYLRDRAWEELARLYEEGMELFVDPLERQQVYLVLGMLYETKLGDERSAFESFQKAWALREGEEGRQKAFEGLLRLGSSQGLRGEFIGWAEEQLVTKLELAERDGLRRGLYQALVGEEQYQRAFFTFAALLTEDPDTNLTPGALEDLAKLDEALGDGEVEGLLAELLEGELAAQTRNLIEDYLRTRAG